MKRRVKWRMLTILGLIMLLISGCGRNESSNTGTENTAQISDESKTASSTADETEPETKSNNILVAYFSRAGENYNVGNVEIGNTELIAGMIAEETDADSFKIQTCVS